jgi:glycosyltransferase involved in cell wall biosynthesis
VWIEEATFSAVLKRKLPEIFCEHLVVFAPQSNVARWLQQAKKNWDLPTAVVVTNGFTTRPTNLKKFEFVHVLAPYYMELANRLQLDTRNWFFVPQPVNTDVFKPRSRDETREFFGMRADDFVVLVVGAINWSYKRIDHAIREVSTLKKTYPKTKLLVVGEAERETPMVVNLGRRLLGNDAIFHTTKHDLMPWIYPVCDVFVLPTRKEITGNVFTEAMACGIPTVGDDYPVTKWLIGAGGDTVNMRQEGKLAGLLETYAMDEALRNARAREARNRAVSTFSAEVVGPQYVKMFEVVAQEGCLRRE